jgi:SNF2 family DNA or RNA helicase
MKTNGLWPQKGLKHEGKPLKRVFGSGWPIMPIASLEASDAPSLKATIYYGGDRNLAETYKQGNLLVTAYGILLRDIHLLKSHPFSVVAFDEIQHIKNAEKKAYQVAVKLQAGMKIGLTGTPIENRLEELKALMDLTIPGYLGTDEHFKKRYSEPIQEVNDQVRQQELSRLISPFTLRRLKKSVLHELPEKIEDIMSCSLSDDPVKLYRDAISSRGLGILAGLKRREEPIPYMHIFALLNRLKQICDHPALLHKSIDPFETYQSGKWDLFKERLIEGIGSGQKIVVYSQYLGMIRIIETFLRHWIWVLLS